MEKRQGEKKNVKENARHFLSSKLSLHQTWLGPPWGTSRLGTSFRAPFSSSTALRPPRPGELKFSGRQPEPTEGKSTNGQAWRGGVRGKNLAILWPWLENLCGCIFNFPIQSPNKPFKRTIMSLSVELFQDLRLFIRTRVRKQKMCLWNRGPDNSLPTKCDPLSLPSSYFSAYVVFTKKAL